MTDQRYDETFIAFNGRHREEVDNMENSKRFSLNKDDLKRILIGAGIAMLGALATYLESTVSNVDFGQWGPIAVAVNSILVNAIRKFVLGAQ